jgi:Family of unknown function (DUF6194)
VVTLNQADTLSATALLHAIKRELAGTVTTEGSGDWFVFYDPDGITVPERRFPFITVVTGDRYDAASRLDRDAASFRVNLGVDRAAYEALFGPAPRQAAGHEVIDTGFDYTTPDLVMPHPFYAPMHWVCIVNPGEQTRTRLAHLMHAAHALARARYRAHGQANQGEPGE